MVTLRILKNYDDIVLNRRVLKGEILEVDIERAKKLHSMRIAEILSIYKLNKKKNGKANDTLQKGK